MLTNTRGTCRIRIDARELLELGPLELGFSVSDMSKKAAIYRAKISAFFDISTPIFSQFGENRPNVLLLRYYNYAQKIVHFL